VKKRQFLGTYKSYDIYFVKNDDTGSSPYCEAVNDTVNKRYIVFATDLEEAKRIMDSILKVTNENNEKNYYSF